MPTGNTFESVEDDTELVVEGDSAKNVSRDVPPTIFLTYVLSMTWQSQYSYMLLIIVRSLNVLKLFRQTLARLKKPQLDPDKIFIRTLLKVWKISQNLRQRAVHVLAEERSFSALADSVVLNLRLIHLE